MDAIGRRYLHLALHLDRHFEGFVDAYFGPPELRDEILTGDPRSLDQGPDAPGRASGPSPILGRLQKGIPEQEPTAEQVLKKRLVLAGLAR